jgi:5-hydroxyisourate hydrolase
MSSKITTHVLDTSRGRPAAGIAVTLEAHDPKAGWAVVGRGTTDGDGRLKTLLPDGQALTPGFYRLTFAVGAYFRIDGAPHFYPEIPIVFEVKADEHHHVPLLLSPYGYSTYRGS